jgi:hypothetical protein
VTRTALPTHPASHAARGVGPTQRSPVSLTEVSWAPRAELELGDWVRQGHWLGVLTRASGWWLGDWLRYGNYRYGERYRAAAAITGYDVQTLMNQAYVASRFEVSRRREKLSFSHHAELAALPADEQEAWLRRAEQKRLSVRALRRELRRHRRPADSSRHQHEVVCPECGHRFTP